MSVIMSITEFEKFYGVNTTTIYRWIRDGMPVYRMGSKGRGAGHQFNSVDVNKWIKDKALAAAGSGDKHAITFDEAKRRKELANAEMAELNLAKEQGKVVDLEELERSLSHRFAEMTSRIRKVPERVVNRVLASETEVEVKEILLSELDQCLELLSRDDFAEEDLDGEEADTESV